MVILSAHPLDKGVCCGLQEAAGAFAELRDVVSLRVEAPRPVDVSPSS